MAVLAVGAQRFALPSRALLGRSAACSIQLEELTVSGEHVVFSFAGDRWSVRDLGSRNGTTVNDVRLGAGLRVEITKGDVIACGSLSVKLLADGPPGPALVTDTDEVVETCGGILALPSPESPKVSLVHGAGGWVIEENDEGRPLVHGERIEIDGKSWQVLAPLEDSGELLATAQPSQPPRILGRLTLVFEASRDEEHVEISLPEISELITGRASNYLLLLLARERFKDRDQPLVDRGWVYSADLARMLRFDLERLNVEVFRARNVFSTISVIDAGRVIERRSVTRQIRLGTDRFELPSSSGK
ncbi:MAG: FHA domain-containing protein [Deltaproteobacteria bacterium]|nr:FHA domain-containing protein [Deltaproteobacteria bacterium]